MTDDLCSHKSCDYDPAALVYASEVHCLHLFYTISTWLSIDLASTFPGGKFCHLISSTFANNKSYSSCFFIDPWSLFCLCVLAFSFTYPQTFLDSKNILALASSLAVIQLLLGAIFASVVGFLFLILLNALSPRVLHSLFLWMTVRSIKNAVMPPDRFNTSGSTCESGSAKDCF